MRVSAETIYNRMRAEPGDMRFACNHAQLHDRTGFTDWADPDRAALLSGAGTVIRRSRPPSRRRR
ncbi:MAG: hypothetical protein COW55_06060 [Rhodobacteraceae bacterium CG17_big_fil_post_rev_8_21_14_2_50_65_11]|nr:MAG: hypothetical protein COW55_06060 [Rhodobacteraceae bacterium CG17_big_fil_post_rev_8_21_14_2_50_65_11]